MSLHRVIIYNIFLLPYLILAQVKEHKIVHLGESIIQGYGEKEEQYIEKAYELFHNNKQKEAYQLAHRLLKTVVKRHSKAKTSLLLGYYFNSKGLIDSSFYFTNKAIKLNIISNDSLRNRINGQAYNLLGINCKNKGLLEKSKKWHIQGISVSQKFNEENLYYAHTHGLALTYSKMKDYENALNLFKECLEYKKNPEIVYGSYINIANIYAQLKDYNSSNNYFEKALQLSQKQEKHKASVVITINIAANYHEQGNFKKAIVLYKSAIKIADKNEFTQLALIARLNIGNSFLKLEQYQKAKKIYESSLSSAIKLGFLAEQKTIYDNLKDIHLKLKDYQNAFEFLTKSIEITDSINQMQKAKEIRELEVEYQTLQKEKEIKVLQVVNANRSLELKNKEEAIKNLKLQQEVIQKENENKILAFQNSSEKRRNEIVVLKKDQELQEAKLIRQKSIKNIILYSSIIILIPIIGLLIMYYQKLVTQKELHRKKEEISQQQTASLIKDQELKLIKASIEGQDKERKRIAQELHDSIGGNLAAIKLQLNNTIVNGQRKSLKTINNQIDDTYEQVRNLSHNLIPKKFRKNNFCDVIEEYMDNIASACNLKTSFLVYPRKEIDYIDEFLQIETFKIIQELITNTIKHAKASSIELQLNLIEDTLNVLFEDDGIGFETKNSIEGIGLNNIKSRLKNISGDFFIDSRINRGTIINLEIPIITIQNEI
ncbi:tetratricopeptide repeat-containing sensor histidine kinase [Aquimarina pacifica]|uniref:tetratricopeptide repeat-containing sensor histidine kinase n=1 Tax=Aquimarina pacifica TaxID=1296415 RepID=UPI00068550B0|nr:tetratricopeptide repeat protein [Aquimarina pacifica]